MKLFTASQIQEWDKYTIANEPISSYNLMERAVQNLYARLKADYDFNHKTVQVFCGSGNNGGDGLALARYFKKDNIDVCVVYAGDITKASADNQANYELVCSLNIPVYSIFDIQTLPKPDYIIDALLGTGLNRSVTPESPIWQAIEHINRTQTVIIAIDIPSGLMTEDNRNNTGIWIKNSIVYSFQQPKIVFFLKEWAKDIQKWQVVDIRLRQDYYQNIETRYYALTEEIFKQHFKPRIKFSHKGTYGHALLAGGLKDKTGAGILAAKAAYRSGCGLLTVISNARHQTAFNVAIPETMFCSTKNFLKHKDKKDFLQKFDSIGIGHGLGTDEKSFDIFLNIIKHYSGRIVIDADAITLLSANPTLWTHLKGKQIVLTPHLREAERLLQTTFHNSLDRIEACQQFAQEKQCCIVLKDTITTILFADATIWFSDNGCAGMAKGGTGDVLTGVLTSTLAQKYDFQDAVLVAVYAHSIAAKKALYNYSDTALIPTDIISNLF